MDLIERIFTAITQTHPIHPMMVHFPIALSGAAFLFALIAIIRKDELYDRIAHANMVLTVLGTIAAGATGMYDNQVNYLGDAPNAGSKVILAVVLLVTSLATVLVRRRNPGIFNSPSRWLYFGGYALSFGLALVLSFLGGVILYGF